METARRRATALLSQLDPSLLDESRGPKKCFGKKNGAHVGPSNEMCVWSPFLLVILKILLGSKYHGLGKGPLLSDVYFLLRG